MASADLVIAFDARIGNLEAALKRTQTALRNTEQAASKTSTTISNNLSTAAQRASSSLLAMGRNILGLGAGFLLAQRAVEAITTVLRDLDALSDVAAQVGVEANDLRNLQVILEEAGGASDQAAAALGRLNDMVGDAARGSEEANNKFAALGIAYRNVDGSVRSTTQVFDDVIKKMREASSVQEQMSIATEFFGRAAARTMVAGLSEMENGLSGATSRLERFGITLGADTVNRLDNLGTAFADLGRVIGTSIANAIAYISPIIVTFLEWLTRQVANAIQIIANIVGAVTSVVGRIGEALGIVVVTPLEQARREVVTAETQLQGTLRLVTRAAEVLQTASADPDSYAARLARQTFDQISARADAENSRLIDARRALRALTPPEPPTVDPAPAIAQMQGGGSTTRAVDEMARAAQRLYDSTRDPLEQFQINAREALSVWSSGRVTEALGGFDTISRAISEYAVNAYNGLTQAGATSEQAQAQVSAAITAMGASLTVGSTEWTRWQEVVAAANAEVARNVRQTNSELEGATKQASGNIDQSLLGLLESVGTGTSTFEDAWKRMLESILRSVIEFVYKMTIQAAILNALKAAFNAFGGVLPSASGGASTGGSGQGRSFAGFPADGGTGDAPGAALFSASSFSTGGGGGSTVGRGLVPAVDAREEPQVNVSIYNNANNTTTRQRETTDSRGNKTIEVMIEEVVKGAFASGKMDPVMQQGYGLSRQGRI
jgi:hypothetical protein